MLIYGANGYTGELVAREAVRRGLVPVLAGRDSDAVGALAAELGLPHRAFGLDDPTKLAEGLAGTEAVLHCAGPFVRTSRAMVRACLAAGVHYLDITGEIAVFERVLAADGKAREAGVVLLPGAGFDVVPSDCLAARLAEAMPDAVSLELAFTATGGSASRGTLKTMIEGMPRSGAVRRDGRIVAVPIAFDAKEIEFGCGRRWAMTIPWGDVSTAFHTTGIPNIRVYTGVSPRGIRRARRMRRFVRVLGLKPVKRLAQWWVGRTVTGPDARARATARTYLWGRVENGDGELATATLETPEGYALTAVSAVECAARVERGEVAPGAWTPARAFGSGFAASLPGVAEGEIVRGRRERA